MDKQEALQRAILKFMPKKKRGFMRIESSCVVPSGLGENYLPYKKAVIKGYEITNEFGLVVILKIPFESAFVFKVKVEHVYHSIIDYIKSNYSNVFDQKAKLYCALKCGKFKTEKDKKKTELVYRQLSNIMKKIKC